MSWNPSPPTVRDLRVAVHICLTVTKYSSDGEVLTRWHLGSRPMLPVAAVNSLATGPAGDVYAIRPVGYLATDEQAVGDGYSVIWAGSSG